MFSVGGVQLKVTVPDEDWVATEVAAVGVGDSAVEPPQPANPRVAIAARNAGLKSFIVWGLGSIGALRLFLGFYPANCELSRRSRKYSSKARTRKNGTQFVIILKRRVHVISRGVGRHMRE